MTVLPRAWTARAFPLALAALVAGAPATWAQQAPPVDPLEAAAMSVAPGRDAASRHDDRAHPKGDVQRALKQRALQARLAGKTTGKTHRVANGQYVELEREGEDSIWTVLGEFGTQINPTYGGAAGPLHNQIPQPDRAVDNTTIWSPDFSQRLLRDPAVHRRARRGLDAQLLQGDLVQPLRGERRGHRLGAGAVQRGQLRRQLLRQHRLRAHVAVRARLAERLVHRPDRRRAGRRSRSTPTWRSSTCGIATTTTATATSTSRTATSTTSSRSTPARARRRAAARRARTPSGAIAGTRSTTCIGVGRSRLQPRRRPPRRQQQLLGRRLHDRAGERRRRRVRARVRPRPRPARPLRFGRRQLHRLLDDHVVRARTATTARSTSDRSPRTWARGRSSSSAG